jgi:hypothetical protein
MVRPALSAAPSPSLRAEGPVDVPLLHDRQQVLHDPVEHQAGGKNRKNTLNMIGIISMILRLHGSAGCGFSFVCTNIETA